MGADACRRAQALELGRPPQQIDTARVYLLEGEVDSQQVRRLADELLCDPVTERAEMGASPQQADALVEIHPLPGVMDPDAEAPLSAALRQKQTCRWPTKSAAPRPRAAIFSRTA